MTGVDTEAAQALTEQSNGGATEAAKKERKEEIRHLEKEAFQLANYYFVFQGVIFTAFYHAPSHLKCTYKWVPITLSALAGFLNFFALLRIALNYKTSLDDADTNATRPRHRRLDPEAHQALPSGDGASDPIAVMCARMWRCFYVVACMVVVLAFLAVTLAGCWLVTCSADTSSAPPPPDAD